MMKRFFAPVLAISFVGVSSTAALSANLPPIQASPQNLAPACATPGRLMAFVRDRNPGLASKYGDLALHYMRIGEELNVRWDYAFYQMLVETGFLTYKGDVRARQNNFAGIAATGNGVPGESFPSVAEGVRAHLEHLMIYAGMPVDNPVAERTRKVQSWGIMDRWRQTFSGAVTYTRMTQKWSPGDRGYSNDIKAVGDRFMSDRCRRPDPEPELLAGIRQSPRGSQPARTTGETRVRTASLTPSTTTPSTTGRSSLGAVNADVERPAGPVTSTPSNTGVSILNAGASSDTAEQTAKAPANKSNQSSVGRFASNLMAAISPPPAATQLPKSCRVWTASYGGQTALIIKSISADHVNYTVLDVNEGRAQREADAYIAAYAKGGETIATFADPQKALNKAFELCPNSKQS